MLLSILLIYLLMGTVAGVLAGLLGIGGGAVLVPGLLAVFALQGIDAPAMVHQAIATSLACVVFTALSSIRAHHRRDSVDWALFRRLAPGLLVGSLLKEVCRLEERLTCPRCWLWGLLGLCWSSAGMASSLGTSGTLTAVESACESEKPFFSVRLSRVLRSSWIS